MGASSATLSPKKMHGSEAKSAFERRTCTAISTISTGASLDCRPHATGTEDTRIEWDLRKDGA